MKPIALLAALLAIGPALAASDAATPASPSCKDVASQPAKYVGTKVSLLAIKYLVSSTAVDGKTVMLQLYACSDTLGTPLEDYKYLFVIEPRAANRDSEAVNSVAQRVDGVVQATLEVPMQNGRFQVKRAMPYLTGVTLLAP